MIIEKASSKIQELLDIVNLFNKLNEGKKNKYKIGYIYEHIKNVGNLIYNDHKTPAKNKFVFKLNESKNRIYVKTVDNKGYIYFRTVRVITASYLQNLRTLLDNGSISIVHDILKSIFYAKESDGAIIYDFNALIPHLHQKSNKIKLFSLNILLKNIKVDFDIDLEEYAFVKHTSSSLDGRLEISLSFFKTLPIDYIRITFIKGIFNKVYSVYNIPCLSPDDTELERKLISSIIDEVSQINFDNIRMGTF